MKASSQFQRRLPLFAAGLALLLVSVAVSQTQAQSVEEPAAVVLPEPMYDTNAWFINKVAGGQSYLVASLFASEFLGVPAAGGVWTDGVNVEAWAAIPTAVPGTWVWLVANGGPAGTFTWDPEAGTLTWADNQGNCGDVITTP